MEDHRDNDGLVPMQKVLSSDSQSSVGRRRSSSGSGISWFKRIGHRMTGTSTEPGILPRRKNSTSSVFSVGTHDHDGADDDDMVNLSRTRSASQSRAGIASIGESITRFGSPKRFGSPLSDNSDNRPDRRRSIPGSSDSHRDSTRSLHSGGSSVDTSAAKEPAGMDQRPPTEDRVTLADLKSRKICTRAVGFAASTFSTNPPQRIPPISPAVGNLEFLENGDLHVKKKPKFHMAGEPAYLQQKHAEIAHLAQIKASENAKRLHTSLNYIHNSGMGFSSLFGTRAAHIDDEEPANPSLALQNVDGSIPEEANWDYRPEGLDSSSTSVIGSDEDLDGAKPPSRSEALPPPDEIYTRCCHLREIMPIRNILRQLKGQLSPIPRVRVANTKPTLVEIQAFSDFLTVVPVASLALDNHILTDEMVRLLLVGLSRSRDIARLTFLNTDLGVVGWQYLCSFLAHSHKSLLVLDLSCTNPTAVPHRVPAFTRRHADWRLLSEALTVMGSLEELNLGGTEIDHDNLRMLLEGGFRNGKILSLANNQLNHRDVAFVVDWANRPDSRLMGIDLSGNDLSREEDWDLVQNFARNPRIVKLTLRQAKLTSLHASRIAQAITPAQASQSGLHSLDLSGNPELFPCIIGHLSSIIHRFPNLSELKLENCNLNNDNIISLCEILSHCHRLVYISFNGNCTLNETAATALCVAVHLSQSICTVEADLPEKYSVLRKQLARYCLQNLERNAGSTGAQPDPADISSFHDELRAVAEAINRPTEGVTCSSDELVDKIDKLRTRIKLRMQTLLKKRRNGPLTVGDREATIRLFFYGTTLDRLRREVLGISTADQQSSEEMVNKMDIKEERPSLARQESLLSLKKLEREEAESHRKYSEQIFQLGDSELFDVVDKLKVGDLGKIIGE